MYLPSIQALLVRALGTAALILRQPTVYLARDLVLEDAGRAVFSLLVRGLGCQNVIQGGSWIFPLLGGIELKDDLCNRRAVQLQFFGDGAEAHLAPAKGNNVLFQYYLDYLYSC